MAAFVPDNVPDPTLDRTAKHNASRNAAVRRCRLNKPRSKPKSKTPFSAKRPFVGVDGEGGGKNEHGQQNYLLLCAGNRRLFNANERLSTFQCLDFLASLKPGVIYVGFAFGYDVTQILRDLPPALIARLFERDPERQTNWVYWGDFAIDYIPRQYFRVARVGRDNKTVKGSARTIWETFGNFQTSFLGALKQFSIGSVVELERIERNKAARSGFTLMTDETIAYCQTECDLLARLMERFRETCYNGNIRPLTWNGAGKLASYLHRHHKTTRRDDVSFDTRTLQQANAGVESLETFARWAYYGGRFEITATGLIPGPIHEYDIRSAYPSAMRMLPCFAHGRWHYGECSDADGLFVAFATFRHPAHSVLCGLPNRSDKGRLSWQRAGSGVYWSCEIDAARKLGADVKTGEGWRYEKQCNCAMFDWVEGLYDYRRLIGSAAAGYPVKLGLNSLYGQLSRRAGGPGPFSNYVWAGLITALTRAAISTAVASDPASVVMIATDGVYSTKPLPLDIGEGLGQWEHKEHPYIFIVQPGLYWGPPKPKTRGVPRGIIETHTEEFENAWRAFLETENAALRQGFFYDRLPAVGLDHNNFIGLRLAHARGKPQTAGVWTSDLTDDELKAIGLTRRRVISFDWSAKRADHAYEVRGDAIYHRPHDGSTMLVSCSYSPAAMQDSHIDALTMESEAMPDYVDMRAPGFADPAPVAPAGGAA